MVREYPRQIEKWDGQEYEKHFFEPWEHWEKTPCVFVSHWRWYWFTYIDCFFQFYIFQIPFQVIFTSRLALNWRMVHFTKRRTVWKKYGLKYLDKIYKRFFFCFLLGLKILSYLEILKLNFPVQQLNRKTLLKYVQKWKVLDDLTVIRVCLI